MTIRKSFGDGGVCGAFAAGDSLSESGIVNCELSIMNYKYFLGV